MVLGRQNVERWIGQQYGNNHKHQLFYSNKTIIFVNNILSQVVGRLLFEKWKKWVLCSVARSICGINIITLLSFMSFSKSIRNDEARYLYLPRLAIQKREDVLGIRLRSSAVTAEALSEQLKSLRKGSDLLCLRFSRVLQLQNSLQTLSLKASLQQLHCSERLSLAWSYMVICMFVQLLVFLFTLFLPFRL